ncbi:hypothetical protein CAPTEDRAFT_152146 [Capitella teleta]|uniref:L-serine deaminase n=1 Tax=Capitella teleta TaxID=283909 RepID=R7V6B8_CAPTE|nr:hypothetical protein CAPTEDRAFT_152146 [Capitella teleta]|eukprot:ELU11896.1 hypothetical protein CAPTEDRAFT_152146 [Capitella teleta]
MMYNPNCDLVTLNDIQEARKIIENSPHFRRTPLVKNVEEIFVVDKKPKSLHFKMENMQVTGSYKVRGALNQLSHLPNTSPPQTLVSYSAGNYGKAFAYLTSKMGHSAKVLMPTTAPHNRSKVIESFGVPTERWPSAELPGKIQEYVEKKNMLFCHSFDDVRLIAGHASAGLEILEDCPEVEVMIVPCGGGALLAGVASAVKLSGHSQCAVYGVEPIGACTMHDSLKEGTVVSMAVKTVASGLAPPMAGCNALRHCQPHVNDVVLVSDEEICRAMFQLFERGIVAEPSGAAGYAALLFGKIPDVAGKNVVVMVTGGNVSPEELTQLKSQS